MSDRLSVSAVVVYHESPATITLVLDALLRQDHALDAIVVVDNGSRQDPAQLQSSYPQVTLIRLAENMGLAYARNAGLARVASELVLLLDDDIYPAPDCLSRMVTTAVETGAAVVCPRILFHPGDSVIQCDGAYVHFSGMLGLNNRDAAVQGSRAVRQECGAFIGACCLFRRQLLVDAGAFDEDYFFYLEDLELSYRLKAFGHAIWCEPRAVVLHERSRGTPNLSFRGEGAYPPRRVYFILRHRWLSIALHYQARSLLALFPALALYDVAAFLECTRRGWLPQWLKALWWLLRGLPGIRRRRQRWQSRRRIPDAAILRGGLLPFTTGFIGSGFAERAAGTLGQVLDWYWKQAQRWL
jgi:GT2 family glycosyltransferase